MSHTPIPPLPPQETIVDLIGPGALAGRQYNIGALAQAFGGVVNPTMVWASMMQERPAAYAYYRELEEKDSDVGSALHDMKLSVLEREVSLDPADDSALALQIRDEVWAMLDPHLYALMDAASDAAGYGLSVLELLFDVSAGQVSLQGFSDCPQEDFSFAAQVYLPQVGPLRYSEFGYSGMVGDLVPEEKFLVTSFHPRQGNRRGRPLLRRCYWPSWIKRNAQKFELRFAERGTGSVATTFHPDASEQEQQQALSAAEAIFEHVAVAVPENFGLMKELLQGARTQNPAIFANLSERMEDAISRAIKGATLTSAGSSRGSGSLALGEVHAQQERKRRNELGKLIVSVVQRHLVTNLVLWNYGPNAPMPTLSINLAEEKDAIQQLAVDAGLQRMGVQMSDGYLRSKYDVPAIQDGDVVLTPAANSVAIAAPSSTSGLDFADSIAMRRVQRDEQNQLRLADGFQVKLEELLKARIQKLAASVIVPDGGAQ